MNKDETIKYMFEAGLLSIPARTKRLANEPPAPKPNIQELHPHHPIQLYKKKLLTKSVFCKIVGIKENEVLPYLVQRGELFSD